MPSPEQLAQLQNPEILNAFLADIKTAEIQSKLDALKAQGVGQQTTKLDPTNFMQEIAKLRKESSY